MAATQNKCARVGAKRIIRKPLTPRRFAGLSKFDWSGYRTEVRPGPQVFRLQDGPPALELWIGLSDSTRMPGHARECWYTTPLTGTAKTGDTVVVADAARRIMLLEHVGESLRDEWTGEHFALGDVTMLGFTSGRVTKYR